MQASPVAARAALGFSLADLAAAGVGVLLTGDREFLVYSVVVAALVGVVARLHGRVGFSPGVVRGLRLLGALHMAGGLVRPRSGGRSRGGASSTTCG